MTMLYTHILILDKTKGTLIMGQNFLEVIAKFEAGTGKVFPQSFIWHDKKSRLIKLLTHARQHP